jgi:hypothetical protein
MVDRGGCEPIAQVDVLRPEACRGVVDVRSLVELLALLVEVSVRQRDTRVPRASARRLRVLLVGEGVLPVRGGFVPPTGGGVTFALSIEPDAELGVRVVPPVTPPGRAAEQPWLFQHRFGAESADDVVELEKIRRGDAPSRHDLPVRFLDDLDADGEPPLRDLWHQDDVECRPVPGEQGPRQVPDPGGVSPMRRHGGELIGQWSARAGRQLDLRADVATEITAQTGRELEERVRLAADEIGTGMFEAQGMHDDRQRPAQRRHPPQHRDQVDDQDRQRDPKRCEHSRQDRVESFPAHATRFRWGYL